VTHFIDRATLSRAFGARPYGEVDRMSPPRNHDHDYDLDLDLIRQVLARKRPAIDRFVERMRCVPRFVIVLNRSLGLGLGEADLEDLVQASLTVVWRKLEQFEGRARLETWVHRIVRWELMNEIRRRRREPHAAEEPAVEPSVTTNSTYDPLDYECLMNALNELPMDESEVIRLRHFEQLPFAAVARRLSIPIETAKTRYYRGLRNLARSLGPRFDEERP